jgi:cellulose synthase (UDP-forming)
MAKENKDLWLFRKAGPFRTIHKVILLSLIVAGLLSIVSLLNWWFKEEHVASMPLFIILSLVFWWGILRMILLWISYMGIKNPDPIAAPKGLSVAIFTTSSPGEPLSMFEKTLEACSKINYPHTTYLLDDTKDPAFKAVAEKHNAVWLELIDLPGAKAGKINAALEKTTEDFILILDPDHIPFPNFFDEVLGYFINHKVGFVQVAQAYYNQYRSYTAKGAAQQTYGFYGPTQMGMNGYNCSVAIGANCTFRRKALESIGGHGIGLAEDLVTSIRIHAAGWQSVYIPTVVSRGLVPEDLGSFCKQQLKWARGVHEVLFGELPKLWKKLSFWQRLSYSMIGSYYFSGMNMLFFILFPYLFLWFGWLPADMNLVDFIINWVPVATIGVLIYLYVQNWFCHPATEKGLHLKGTFLKYACWPIFALGFLLSLVNGKIPYIPTAKQAVKGFTPFVRPLLIQQAIFIVTVIFVVILRKYFTAEARLELSSGFIWGMVGFSIISFLMSIGGLYAAIESDNISPEDPWEKVSVDKITHNLINN